MIESRNNGVPLIEQAPKSKVTKAIELLAQQIDSGEQINQSAADAQAGTAATDKPKRRLFSFLGK
jgi:pilus assembly protein CpaE